MRFRIAERMAHDDGNRAGKTTPCPILPLEVLSRHFVSVAGRFWGHKDIVLPVEGPESNSL